MSAQQSSSVQKFTLTDVSFCACHSLLPVIFFFSFESSGTRFYVRPYLLFAFDRRFHPLLLWLIVIINLICFRSFIPTAQSSATHRLPLFLFLASSTSTFPSSETHWPHLWICPLVLDRWRLFFSWKNVYCKTSKKWDEYCPAQIGPFPVHLSLRYASLIAIALLLGNSLLSPSVIAEFSSLWLKCPKHYALGRLLVGLYPVSIIIKIALLVSAGHIILHPPP